MAKRMEMVIEIHTDRAPEREVLEVGEQTHRPIIARQPTPSRI